MPLRIALFLLTAAIASGEVAKPKVTAAARSAGAASGNAAVNNCVDVPRVATRKKIAKLNPPSAVDAVQNELSGTALAVTLTDALELALDLEAKNEKSADQVERLVRMLTTAQTLKERSGNTIPIDLGKNAKISKSGTTVRTTVSLTDEQLEKLLAARYGQKLVSQARALMIYVYGLQEGTRSIPFEETAR